MQKKSATYTLLLSLSILATVLIVFSLLLLYFININGVTIYNFQGHWDIDYACIYGKKVAYSGWKIEIVNSDINFYKDNKQIACGCIVPIAYGKLNSSLLFTYDDQSTRKVDVELELSNNNKDINMLILSLKDTDDLNNELLKNNGTVNCIHCTKGEK